jgi:dipeptidyl aminopeptidase
VQPTPLRLLLGALIALVLTAALIGALAAASYTGGTTYRVRGVRRITMDHVMNGTFYAGRQSLHWVPEGTRAFPSKGTR